MKFRQIAAAYLINENQELLFLQKPEDAKFLGGFLVPIGGHIEEGEFTNPKKACLREIKEETGLSSEQINDLTLQYIVHRIKDQEIRIQYIFVGHVSKKNNLIESDEGHLTWIHPDEIDDLKVTVATKEVVKHLYNLEKLSERIFIGTMGQSNGDPQISWSVLEDWDGHLI